MKKMQTHTALCPPEVNKAPLCFSVKELWAGLRACHQNNGQDSTKKSIPKLFVDSTSSFENFMAIKLRDTCFREFCNNQILYLQ